MIITLVLWIYIAILSFFYGGMALVLYEKITQKSVAYVPVPLIVIMGMVILATVGMWLSLFIKLGFLANLLLITGAAIIYFLKYYIPPRLNIQWSWQQIIIGILAFLIFITILENSTHTTANADTALYHAQSIHWIEDYKVVPGLGNLHTRLAFNSSWLLLNALFSFSFAGDVSFHVLSGFFVLFSMLYFLRGGAALLRQEYALYNFISVLLIPILFYVQGDEIKSPGTDLPATIFIWLVVVIWLEFIVGDNKNDSFFFILVTFIAFALTVKISVFPLLLLMLYPFFLLLSRKEWHALFALLSMAGFIILPWLARNVILSGYLIFPFPGIDIFDVDWKVPLDRVQKVKDAIIGFARSLGKNWIDTPKLSFRQWYPFWFTNHTSNQKAIFLLAVSSPLGVLYQSFARAYQRIHSAFYILFGVLYASLLFWLSQAPSFRFGYGFLLSLISLGYLPILIKIFHREKRVAQSITVLILMSTFLYLGYFFSKSLASEPLSTRLLFPMPYSSSKADACPLGELEAFCTGEQYQCHYDAFPCVISLPPNLSSRDGTLAGGFRFSE